jgi:hypothetical protein
MKTLSLVSILLLLCFVLIGAPGLFADDDEPGGDSAFDEPGTEEEATPEEPKPATFSFKDYKIIMQTKDGRFWKQDKNYTENDEKGNVLLKLVFKLPKSESHFDVNITGAGWGHKFALTFADGSKCGASNYKVLCSKFFESDKERYKGAKNIEKPKKVTIGKKRWKAYRYALTGSPGSMPMHKIGYCWKFKEKTYFLHIRMNTTAAKNERILKEVENLLKSMQEKPQRRR